MLATVSLVLRPTRRECCGLAATAALHASVPSASAAIEVIAASGTDGRDYCALKCGSGTRAVISSQASLERIELALTLRCGYLFDPPEFDGVAHLAEHVTLAADPGGLGSFIDDRVGALNAFTAEETTTFHLEFDMDDGAEPLSELREVCQRFAATFAAGTWRTTEALVRQELSRIDAEWRALVREPPRQALELAALRLNTKPMHPWRRVGRGNADTLPLSSVGALVCAVDELRTSHYDLSSATIALTSPLPLETAAAVLRSAFATPLPRLARHALVPVQPLTAPSLSSPSLSSSSRSLPLAADGGTPLIVESPRGGRTLTLAWSVPLDDPVSAARSKPLALLGMALTSPHTGSLVSRLREARLCPPLCVQEPIVLTRTVARTSHWAIFQVEIVLADGAESRWREALQLCRVALSTVAASGLPEHVASESAALASITWRYSSRPPTALELSVDLQMEPMDALAVRAGRSFVGPTSGNAAAATAASRYLAASSPTVTLYLPSLSMLKMAPTGAPDVPLPGTSSTPLSVPLRYAALPSAPGGSVNARPIDAPVALPPANVWVPAEGPAVVRPLMERVRVGACEDYRTGGGLPRCLQARTMDGMGVLQLPACISGSGVELGSKAALAAVGCAAVPRPFAAVLLQLYTARPQNTYNGDQRASKAAALAELWRYALAEAVGVEGALAARAGAKWEVTFNPAGLRVAVTGHREQVQALLALVLRLALRPRPEASEFEAGRYAALRLARSQRIGAADLARAREANLQEATPAELAAELGELWSSILAADLLLAGPVRKAVAAELVADARAQLRPILPDQQRGEREPDLQPEQTFARGLAAWEPLLYRPSYEPRSLAQNLCLEPAIAATLDQCGSL